MTVTIDGITYEGTPSEIRDIVENPPHSPHRRIKQSNTWKEWPCDVPSSPGILPDFPAYPGIDYPSNAPIYPTSPVTARWEYYSHN